MEIKTKRNFKEIAYLIQSNRVQAGLTQVKLSRLLGYKNGQFISNIERGLCSIPADKIYPLSKVLDINFFEIIEAMTDDHTRYLSELSIELSNMKTHENLPATPKIAQTKTPTRYYTSQFTGR